MVTNSTEFFKKLMCYSYSSHSSTLWSLNKYKWEWFYSSQTNKLTCHSSAHLRHKNHPQISFSPKTLITLAVAWTVNAYISDSNNAKRKHSNCWPLNLGVFSIFSATHSWRICLFYFFCFFLLFFGVLRENNYFQIFNIISSGKKFLVLIFVEYFVEREV